MKEIAIGGVMHVSSIVFRSTITKNIPEWFFSAVHGDYALAMLTAANGKIYFINEAMSSYRTGVEASLMTKFRETYSKEKDIEYHHRRIKTIDLCDEYYGYKFHQELEGARIRSELQILILKGELQRLKEDRYKMYLKKMTILQRIKLLIIIKYPWLAQKLAGLLGKMRLIKSRKMDKTLGVKGNT